MYCKSCGKRIRKKDKFCRRCGKAVDEEMQWANGADGVTDGGATVGMDRKGRYKYRYGNDKGTSESGRYPSTDSPDYRASNWWFVLGLLLPFIGVLFWLGWKNSRFRGNARKGRKAGFGTFFGCILYAVVIAIVLMVKFL